MPETDLARRVDALRTMAEELRAAWCEALIDSGPAGARLAGQAYEIAWAAYIAAVQEEVATIKAAYGVGVGERP